VYCSVSVAQQEGERETLREDCVCARKLEEKRFFLSELCLMLMEKIQICKINYIDINEELLLQ
jgi:hypothetical protein